MARTRTVYPKEQVAHIWANAETGAAFEIRTPTGNLYTAPVWCDATKKRAGYSESAIWSYGRHYCLARHTVTRSGLRAVLFNRNAYSVTTQRQRSIVRSALPGYATIGGFFQVSNPAARNKKEHAENLADMRADYESALCASEKPRTRQTTRDAHLSRAASILADANAYAHAFKLRAIKPATVADIAAREARIGRAVERARKLQAERDAIEHAKRVAESAERLAEWKAGRIATHALGWLSHSGPISLRVIRGQIDAPSPDDRADQVESTRGATFPAEHARKAWPIIRACREQGRAFEPTGLRAVSFGRYPLSGIDERGNVKAGCHTLAFEECERLAAALGLLP